MSGCANSNKTLEETEGADKYKQIQRDTGKIEYKSQNDDK